MSFTLQTDVLKLRRPELDPRFTRAIEQVQKMQQPPAPVLAWHTRQVHSTLTLDDGTVFVPDGEDASEGSSGKFVGGMTMFFGLALAGIVLDGEQDEAWMLYVAPILIAVGAWLFRDGTRKAEAVRLQPCTTGLYLFSDVLLYVTLMGCKLYPRANVHSFEFRENNETQSHTRTILRYLDDDGALQETRLISRDVSPHLTRWMAVSS